MKKTAKVKLRTKQIPGRTYPFYCVQIESERGWGQKVFHVTGHATEEEARAAVWEVNKQNNLPSTPDWYVYAELSTDNRYAQYIGK